MIHYDLQCADGHRFDGWFAGSSAFDRQAASGLVECPECGSRKVARALMAPAVPKRGAAPIAAPTAPPTAGLSAGLNAAQTAPQTGAPAAAPAAPGAPAPRAAKKVAGGEMPAQLRAMLQRMRAEVERNCDYVGPGFAQEARRMHQGESDRRGIYGETTPEEAQALAEDGIEVTRIPWVPRADG